MTPAISINRDDPVVLVFIGIGIVYIQLPWRRRCSTIVLPELDFIASETVEETYFWLFIRFRLRCRFRGGDHFGYFIQDLLFCQYTPLSFDIFTFFFFFFLDQTSRGSRGPVCLVASFPAEEVVDDQTRGKEGDTWKGEFLGQGLVIGKGGLGGLV
jgi:hypothetical protein